jgi:hypothetical protein
MGLQHGFLLLTQVAFVVVIEAYKKLTHEFSFLGVLLALA